MLSAKAILWNEEKYMKCPKCEGDMKKGLIVDKGHYDVPNGTEWAEAISEGILGGDPIKQRTIESYRCQKCGYLENYAK
jgi:ssDNA-binding Zn-finger/Zn-ribbon topoisomerase 1